MNKATAIAAFDALSHETRLDVFRLLVKAGQGGLHAGEIAARLDVRQNTLSSHLAALARAGLVRGAREGRSIRYRADMDGMRALIAFLMEDCCGGEPARCQPVLDTLICG